ncbi:flagellar biosynthesis protein FliQ [Citricoccus nitrophenolicus]|uniref:Flagellar biosynthetic protein FliQ n=1 Tax=Citricoccus nitrophenolicus TaxID=863575 RepID=A0ABV0IJW6_9MICC|nr:flagellar biosynthesis protein FliQ [Citricoccus sp. I39-566]WMY77967.1 flagellar biosynthesis protein FliQ [Citricoccus sp. I39-566]
MDQNAVVDLGVQALLMAAKLSAPVLITALAVGLLIGLLQSATQVQEITLSFVPKAIAVAAVLAVSGYWMIQEMVTFTQWAFDQIPNLING